MERVIRELRSSRPALLALRTRVARWEFLLERPEGIQHKLDLGAVCGGKGYGLLVKAPTEEWAGYETQLLGGARVV